MRQNVPYSEYAGKVLELLPKGAFLTTSAQNRINTMTIGWGSIGFQWQTPIFTVMVRPSRFTYELIEKNPEFTVSIPLHGQKEALAFCGAKSGRDLDKIQAAGLTTLPGQQVGTPVIAGCGLHFECKIVYKQEMQPPQLDPSFAKAWYPSGDYHTLYHGEIVACYLE